MRWYSQRKSLASKDLERIGAAPLVVTRYAVRVYIKIIFLKVVGRFGRYYKYRRKMMLTLLLWAGMLGYGVGYEGYSDGKVYVGTYTPKAEYGWVVTDRGIYLDTILEKN
jgi:hypothetical protein